MVSFVPLARPEPRFAPRVVCAHHLFGLAWTGVEVMLLPLVLSVAGELVPENLRIQEVALLIVRFFLLDHKGIRLRRANRLAPSNLTVTGATRSWCR
jgi:hypothetical protein